MQNPLGVITDLLQTGAFSMPKPYLKQTSEGVLLSLHIQPNAKKTELVGLHGEALKIRIQAPPVDDAANEALLKFIGARLGLTSANLILVKGHTSRQKRVLVRGKTLGEVDEALELK